MTIRFVLRNGKEIDMKCEKFNHNRNEFTGNGMITGYEASGITENKILGINFDEVVAVYRLMSDEVDKKEDESNEKEK